MRPFAGSNQHQELMTGADEAATGDGDGERRLDRVRHTSLDAEATKHAFPLPLRDPLFVCVNIHDGGDQREARVVVVVDQ